MAQRLLGAEREEFLKRLRKMAIEYYDRHHQNSHHQNSTQTTLPESSIRTDSIKALKAPLKSSLSIESQKSA
jgi:hypothetical protein